MSALAAPVTDRRPALAALTLGSLAMIVTGLQSLLHAELGSLAMIVTGLQSLLHAELAAAGRLADGLLLPAALIDLFCMGASVALFSLLIRPTRLPLWAAGAAIVCVLAGLAPLLVTDALILVARVIGGLAGGVLVWITVGMIARQARPEPWAVAFFLAQSAGQVFAAAIAAALGPNGAVVLAASLSGLCVAVAPLLSQAMPDLAQAGDRRPDRRGLLGLTALFLYCAANATLWFKMRDLAATQGLDAATDLVVLTTLAAQMLGAMAALALADRLDARRLFGLVVACLLVACAGLAFRPPAPLFVAAFGLLAFASLLLGASLFCLLNAADPSRRAGAVSPTAQFLAATLGPLAAMAVSALAGPSAVLALAPVLALAALACAHFSLPKGGPASPDCA